MNLALIIIKLIFTIERLRNRNLITHIAHFSSMFESKIKQNVILVKVLKESKLRKFSLVIVEVLFIQFSANDVRCRIFRLEIHEYSIFSSKKIKIVYQ